jgi:hypothetical protein
MTGGVSSFVLDNSGSRNMWYLMSTKDHLKGNIHRVRLYNEQRNSCVFDLGDPVAAFFQALDAATSWL